MKNLVLEEGKYFNWAYESTKRGLKCFFGKKFGSLEEIAEKLKEITPSVYIPKEISVRVERLPCEIREYPIFGLIIEDPEPEEVARIKLTN
ncbi:MAG: hypothetical protein NTU63_02955 [Candidatus Pacearchaeota archaeon]|nr:hypothetical protein [Candidatus Pacearchaeota archaeon]